MKKTSQIQIKKLLMAGVFLFIISLVIFEGKIILAADPGCCNDSGCYCTGTGCTVDDLDDD